MKAIFKYLILTVFAFSTVQNYAYSNPFENKSKEETSFVIVNNIPDNQIPLFRNFSSTLNIFSFVKGYYFQDNKFFIEVLSENKDFIIDKLSFILNKIPASSDDECCCPKTTYTKSTRTTVICNDGTNTDTGWQAGPEIEVCGTAEAPDDLKDCNNDTDPGDSMGDDDVVCTTCNYIKYSESTVDSSECCVASSVTTTVSGEIPGGIESIANSLASAAKAAPMIKEMEFEFSGNISFTQGEECCLPDLCADPVSYEEYGASISAGISITLNVPGWDWSFDKEWHGVYHIHAEISLGPEITISPSATASVAGKKYLGDCEGCLTFNIDASVGLDIKFQGTIECYIELEIWPHKTWEISATAELGVKTSINANGYYKCCVCTGKKGCVSCGKLEGYASVSFTFLGKTLSFGKTVTLLPGYSHCF